MAVNTNDQYYARRAQQERDMAALATDRAIKALHLKMAAEYTNLKERTVISNNTEFDSHEID